MKKKVLIAGLFVCIMLLVPFNSVTCAYNIEKDFDIQHINDKY